MTFQAALKKTADEIEALLDDLLSLDGARAPRVTEAMRYSALAQGKRLRPFFVAESARILGADHHQALRVGAALECIHCYSLVHDDLPAMDDDDLRRGKPTCHIAFDEATAILAGDGLLTVAFEIITDPATHSDGAVRAELALKLARASGHNGMVGGQMLDLAAEGMTMVCVTHEMGFARSAADEVLFMDGGLIVEHTTPDGLFNNPQHERTKLFLSQILQH